MRKIGVELELLVLNQNFEESSRADELIQLGKQNNIPVVAECSKSMIEINSDPFIDSFKVAENLKENLRKINNLADALNLKVLPIEIPLNSNFVPLLRNSSRYSSKKKLLGEERFEISGKVMGFHTHYDLEISDSDKINQINFLTLMDPLAISLTASSPYQLKQNDTLITQFNNWRTYSYRHIVHEKLPFQGHLQKLNPSYQKYISELEQEFSKFIQLSNEQKIDFSKDADQYNSIWGPVRINPIYNTVELRSMGANPDVSINLSLTTLIKGGLRRIKEENPRDNVYLKLLLDQNNPRESFNILQALSHDAMRFGLQAETVANYCQSVFKFCSVYLNMSEKKQVENISKMIEERKNMADYIKEIPGDNQERYLSLHKIYLESLKG